MTNFGSQGSTVAKVILLSVPLLLAACASQPEAVEETAAAQSAEPATERASLASVADRGQEQANPLLSQLVIHFAFDDAAVGTDYQDLIIAHGEYLADHGDISLRLEGHADERGTREYNVGLGERRALTVRQLLLLQGARDEQIETISFGEESPVVADSNERSWAQNRRVEFNYLTER